MGAEMAELPPDLDRLGRALTHATAHAAARRDARIDRRRRLVGCLMAGLLVFAAMTPSHLGPADKPDFLPFTIDHDGRRGAALRHPARAALPLPGSLQRARPAAPGRPLNSGRPGRRRG